MGEKITLRFLWLFYKNTEMSKKHCIKPGHYDILYKDKVCYRMYMKIVNRGVSMATRSILKNIVVKGFPRRCGGDPWMFKLEVTSHDVFPAGAGVILCARALLGR